MTNQRLNSD